MYYESIRLKGFKRMYLSGISEFKMTMPTAVTLILGTNGSGKSCLLNELSPLPGSKDAFEKDGLKEVIIEHHNKRYCLTTTFNQGVKCSFKEIISETEEIELNTGGTQAVQKTLAEEIFGYTDTIHGLINNKVNFTDMGPLKRREWFTLMSSVSYDYVISLYMRLKEKQRDLQGYIKEEKQKLLQLEMVKEDKEHVSSLLKDIDNIQELMKALTSMLFSNRIINPYDLEETYKSLPNKLNHEVKEYMRINGQLDKLSPIETNGQYTPYHDYKPRPLESILQSMADRRNSVEQSLQQYNQQVLKLEKDIRLLEDTQIGNLKEMDIQYRTLEEKIHNLQNTNSVFNHPDTLQPKEALVLLRDMLPSLIEIWNHIPDNDGRYTKAEYERLKEEIFNIDERLRRLQIEEEKSISLSKVLDGKRVECPSCHTSFIPGSDEHRAHELKHGLKGLQNEREGLLKRKGILTPQYESQVSYLEAIRAYSALRLNDTPLRHFHQYLLGKSILTTQPQQAIDIANQYEMELNRLMDIEHYQNEIKKLNQVKETLAQTSTEYVSISILKDNLEKIGNQIQTALKEKDDLTKSIKQAQHALSLLQTREAVYTRLNELIKTTAQLNQELTQSYIDNQLREEIERLRFLQSNLLNEYTKIQYKQDNIENIRKSIEEAELKERAYGILVEELSPNKGLIAEGLFGFIQYFLKDMNAVIAKIWSYPLFISIAEEMDEKGLTYRFPVLTGVGETEIPDVNAGSAGIKEIINLAFKIVSMKYLKISDYPLVLDEFGRTFDATHRLNAGKAIHSLISTKEHQQLFMVSHYADAYGSMANINITVIDDSNIILPLNAYNQHTSITYADGTTNKPNTEKD